MAWFKVDDKLHDHRKARAAGRAAMGVWVLAGSWAADNLTDGFVPASVLPRWGTRRDAQRLVEVGLWVPCEQDGELGWRFHEWFARNPARADLLALREARAEAGRSGGKASGQSRRQAKAKQVASGDASGLREPPNPNPNQAVSHVGLEGDAAPKRGARLDPAFIPSEKSRTVILAEIPGLDIQREHAKFIDYWTAQPGQRGVKLDWDATWRNWMRRAAETAPNGRNRRQQETDDLFARAAERLGVASPAIEGKPA